MFVGRHLVVGCGGGFVPDVFISYSRRDSDFVNRLTVALDSRGKRVWLDTESIADAEVFPLAIRAAIESSDAFLFVISPDAVHSAYCEQEVAYAVDLGKRIVPVLRERVPDPEIPAEIRDRNWIPFTDDGEFGGSLERIVQALDTDLEHGKQHTRWLTKAIEWNAEGRDRSFLLHGSELGVAESWLAASELGADPAPTTLQREYLLASRQAHERRQRATVTVSLAIAAIAVALLVFALISRGQAVAAKTAANSRALAAQSESDLVVDPGASILLAERALHAASTPEAQLAMREALDASPFLRELPARPKLSCPLGDGATIAYRPDGNQIAEGFCNAGVLLVDAHSGEVTRRITNEGDASSVAYSGDGKILAVAGARGVGLYNDRTGAIDRSLPAPHRSLNAPLLNEAVALTFSPGDTRLAVATVGGILLYDLPSGAPRVIGADTFRQQTNFGSVVFTPDGRSLIVGTSQPFVGVFDVRSGARVRELALGAGQFGCDPAALAITATGTLFVGTNPCDGGVTVTAWSARTWRAQYTLTHLGSIAATTLTASVDGTKLAVGDANGVVSVWSIDTRTQLVPIVGIAAIVNQVAFDPTGNDVATASDDGVPRVWRASGPETLDVDTGAGKVWSVGLGASRLVATVRASGRIDVETFRLPSGAPETRFTVERSPLDAAWVSPDGKLVAALDAAGSGDLTIWDVATGRLLRRVPGVYGNSVAWSADDRELAVGSDDPVMSPELVDVANGKSTVLAGRNPGCYSADAPAPAFSANGDLVAWSTFCGQVVLWNTHTAARIATFDDHAEVSGLAVDQAGARVAVASWNGALSVVSPKAGKVVMSLVAGTQAITDVAYGADGRWLVTTSQDGTVRVWDARSGDLLRVDHDPAAAQTLAFGPGSRTVATADALGVLRAWNSCSGCGDTKALLALASPRAPRHLTPLERSASAAGG